MPWPRSIRRDWCRGLCRVRFVYLRPVADYLSVTPRRDVIGRPVDPILDIGSWDLRKALQSKNIMQIKELMIDRRVLVKDLTAARNRQKLATLPLIVKMIGRRITQIQSDIATIETDIAKRIAEDPELASRAAILLIDMPELGAMDHKQAASLAGIAPMTRASGGWNGKDHICGGRAAQRQALYIG
jgi:hypothetical protein